MAKLIHFTPSGPLDPFQWCEPRNFGAISGTRHYTQYRAYSDDIVVWQESVYDRAETLVTEHGGFEQIIDLGCGSGVKTQARFGNSGRLMQVDRNDFRDETCRTDGTRFVQASLEQHDDLDALLDQLDVDAKTLIVCSDVIEHLLDPRPLLCFLRRLLQRNAENTALLSTPDHEVFEGTRDALNPSNREHYRQWSVFELGSALRSAGFEVCRFGRTQMHKHDDVSCTILAELRCTPEHYASFLATAGLPQPSERLLITGEHKLCDRGGGIGAYAMQSDDALSDDSIMLFHGQLGYLGYSDDTNARQWCHAEDIVTDPQVPTDLTDRDSTPVSLLEATKTLIFFFPEIRWIECADYLGYAHSVLQAKMAAILPSRIRTVCYGHGNLIYLEHNHSNFFFDPERQRREKACIETADLTLIPSDYLDQIYTRAGLRPRSTARLAYPYTFTSDLASTGDYDRIKSIVFFGKRTRGKGYHLFVEALNQIAGSPQLAGIEHIYVAGVGDATAEFDDRLKGRVENIVYPSSQTVQMMREARPETLAVIPYLGDNFPYSVHELIDAGIETIFARAGGVPEVYAHCDPEEAFTFEPKSEALASKLLECLSQSAMHRGANCVEFAKRFRYHQSLRNEQFSKFDFAGDANAGRSPAMARTLPPYDVVITYHNEDLRFVSDALDGIANQRHRPEKVYFVDDASRSDAIEKAKIAIAAESRLDVEVIHAERNLGLAGARCLGMEHVRNAYFLAHDVDNILRGEATEQLLRLMMADESAGAATAYNVMFQDNEGWIDDTQIIGIYRPTYPDLGALVDNTFGDALAMYRKSAVEAIGGWRSTGREPLEDFELFYRLHMNGHPIRIVPDPILLYRVREDSMLRTYDRFTGYLRLADVLTEKLGTDGMSLMRHVQQVHTLQSEVARLQGELMHVHAQQGGHVEVVQGEQTLSIPVELQISHQVLPGKLRKPGALLGGAMGSRDWLMVALRHPLNPRHWQTVRRAQRAARKLGLRD